jgi:phenylpropionate dioxygenase-like ring-hydroxylating dioxygenase large terminal subunit
MTPYFKSEKSFQTGSKTLEREYYTSLGIFAAETERIFTRQWFCAGH